MAEQVQVEEVDDKPHAVFLPFPAQGHVTPAFKLALLLHRKGFRITFVNTDYNHRRLLRSRGGAVLTSPDFQFEAIPDGLPTSDSDDKTQDIALLFSSIKVNCLPPFRSLLHRLNAGSSPVTCIVSDAIMTFSVTAAREIGVPAVCFRTTSAKSFLCSKNIRLLLDKGLLPLKDAACMTNGYLDMPVDWIPGLNNTRLREFPTFVRTTDIDDPLMSFVLGEMETASEASAIIFNTFDALEEVALTSLTSLCPRVYCIGPVHASSITENDLNSVEMSLWKQESDCLHWLDSRNPNSVVYMNFGSITVLTPQEIAEFAWGVANSGKDYLWIIRPDSVVGDACLPPEFVSQTKAGGRGLIVTGWCPQLRVLKHSSVAAFLTHCGWNSVVESLSTGVPMICCPFFADQPINCRQACVEWGVGMEIERDMIWRDGVERIVREMVDGDEGKKMKERAMEWKKKVEEAVGVGGSSFLNLDRLVKDVLLSKTNNATRV